MTGKDEPDRLDAPNQQVVRGDSSSPWDEGEGGSTAEKESDGLDDMTKTQLLEYAAEHGVDAAGPDMTKAEIRAAIDEAAQ